jgi:hypothetical protein
MEEKTLYLTESDPAELQEQLRTLEFMLDSLEWRAIGSQAEQEFSRAGLRNISQLARVMFLKNPLINRGVNVKRFYVWGQGWTIRAQDEQIQAVIDDFLYDQKNDDAFGSHEARMGLEQELQIDGNLFFCFFVNSITGKIRIRTISFEQIEDVYYNPDDGKEPWYYRRSWGQSTLDTTNGVVEQKMQTAYYPDWRYNPVNKPKTIAGYPVNWSSPLYHVKVGGFGNWKFGVSEVYAAIDWARAYKAFLEDWASIVRAYRKFAFQLTAPSNQAVAAVKSKLTTSIPGLDQLAQPPPLTASTFVATDGYKLDAVKTQGATVSADDGRRMLLMAAAVLGLPETFFGDASVGTLATAQSLDRPTELMMIDRQTLWRDMTLNIIEFVQLWAVKAAQGELTTMGHVETVIEDGQICEDVVWNDGVDGGVSVYFPPIVQHDIPAIVNATVQAATLGAAGTLAGTIDLPTLSRILLNELGVPDADEIVERLFPDGTATQESAQARPVADVMMIAAVTELRTALLRLQETQKTGAL